MTAIPRRGPRWTDSKRAGVPGSDISLVANKYVSDEYADVDDVSSTGAAAGTGAGIGTAVGGGAGLLAGLGLLAIPGLGPVVAAGWLAATAVGAVAGAATGGIVGALVGAGMEPDHANVYSEAIRRGGTLVTVRVRDEDAARLDAIMAGYQPDRSRDSRGGVPQDRLAGLRPEGASLQAEPGRGRPHAGELAGLSQPQERRRASRRLALFLCGPIGCRPQLLHPYVPARVMRHPPISPQPAAMEPRSLLQEIKQGAPRIMRVSIIALVVATAAATAACSVQEKTTVQPTPAATSTTYATPAGSTTVTRPNGSTTTYSTPATSTTYATPAPASTTTVYTTR